MYENLLAAAILSLGLISSPVFADGGSRGNGSEEASVMEKGNADVLFVRAELHADGKWTFTVTVSHPDKGWNDYADGWDVVTDEDTVLKANPSDPFTRLLLHPHDSEQPFTRSQGGIIIPENVHRLTVRAHDLKDGFGGQTVFIDLTQGGGDSYEIVRP